VGPAAKVQQVVSGRGEVVAVRITVVGFSLAQVASRVEGLGVWVYIRVVALMVAGESYDRTGRDGETVVEGPGNLGDPLE